MRRLLPWSLAGLIVVVAVLLVIASIRRPDLPTFPPTPPEPAHAGAGLIGPRLYTVDASSTAAWRYFDFSRASLVESPQPHEWDLAFRRHHIIANGGEGFVGNGGILDLGEIPFDSVAVAPESGYVPSRAARDTINPAVARWYDYSFITHLLTPKPRVYAVRTADGRYAKLAIVSYYCPGALPACLTFRYVYQGDGSRKLAP
ncbi:MAG: HmuY family protein [Gemmatimonadetes bacterium]|nr:HmuY family protein [Gemmatimonadota bacterium]